MAQPEIIKDIDARVKDTGDTMTGNLTAPMFIGSLQGNADTATKASQDSDGAVISSTYLKLSGGIMTGPITLASKGYQTNNIAGYYIDEYGNFVHSQAETKDYWHIDNNAKTISLKYYFETGNLSTQGTMTAPTFIGSLQGNADTATKATQDGNGNIITSTYLPLSGGTINGNIITNGSIWYKGLRMQSYEITVNGDLNTYYPVAVDSYYSGNTEAIVITVSKTLGTTSPAWSGNHSNGTSSLMASYLVRNNGWDGNGNFVYSITPPQQGYANILGHVELRQSAAHHLVFWLRGGGATYRIAANIPTNINVYLTETNIGAPSYPSNVAPRTNIGNAGWIFENPTFLPIKGGTVDGNIRANAIYGAVWNDYAEYRSSDPIEPGRTVCETGNGTLKLSTERLQPGANVVSDTFGFAIGETENCKTPIAVSGRALVYTYENRYSYKAGDPVCAAPGGTVSKMSREEVMMYPDRIVGTVSEIPEYERWGTGNVEVKNRIWIKVK